MIWDVHGVVGVQAHAGQNALERKLNMLETQQKEVHDALVAMEGEALRLYKVPPPLMWSQYPLAKKSHRQ